MKNLNEAFALFNSLEWKNNLFVPAFERKRFLVEKTTDWEIVLMVWGPGASTPIHDHNESKCWTRILEGQLIEKNINRSSLEVTATHTLSPAKGSFIEDELGAHKLSNSQSDYAVSLHFYARPIEFCHVYDEALGIWIINKVNYDQMVNNEMHEKSIAP